MLRPYALAAHWRATDQGLPRPTGGLAAPGACAAATCAIAPDGEIVVLRCARPRGHCSPHRIIWPALDEDGGPIAIEWRQPGLPAV
ncbi:MAG TPA: hypothetical protein VFE37_13740 [Chloroflexota bacterium]|nr:hypothetical protein [Chloroflexota bacterium]